ncbi:MAG: oxidoreductase [Candidatus Marinimicrobia bacterium]|nr:oxidoreductase [Candidatus Neomarinimicrobiota bacterium]
MKYKIVITGVTKGLGRALAEYYIADGHIVIGCGRNVEEIDMMSNNFSKNNDFQIVDVSKHENVSYWARDIIDRFGTPNFILNNAGIINKNKELWNIHEKEFSEVMNINVKGMHNTIRNFVPKMIEANSGTIVNFSSGWGRSTSPKVAPYCASKWAVEGLSKSLAQELPNGLACVAFNPGVIDTNMLRSCWNENAGMYETPSEWVKRVAPYLLKIDKSKNGASLSAP